MPLTRSEKSRSRPAAEPSTSTDWSMNTPTETTTTESTQSTLTRRTPPRPAEGPQRTTGDQLAPAVLRNRGGVSPARPAGDRTTVQAGRGDPMGSNVATPTQEQPATRPASQAAGQIRHHEDLMARIAEVEKKRIARMEDDALFASPAAAGSKRVPPRIERRVDTRSVKSSRKRAEAEAKMQIARRELEVAEARSKIAQAELEMLQVDSDLEDEAGEEEDRQKQVEYWLDQSNLIEREERAPPQHTTENKKSDIQELAQAISKLSQKAEASMSKHVIELPYFNGASEEWLAFRRSFEDTAPSFTHAQNLARLRRTLQGRAREAVKSLLFTAEDPSEVMRGLEARFGRPGALALSELEKLKSLPRVTESPHEVCTFASHVRNSVATIKALGKKQYLSSPETMKTLIEKMPSSMKYRWFIYHRSRRDEEQQELVLINDFLETEADMCGDFAPPEVSWEMKKSRQQYQPVEAAREPRRNAFQRPVNAVQETSQKPEKPSCSECQEEHWLVECRKFKEADTDARWEMAKKGRVCFKCLRYRHSRPNCRAPTCKKCTRWHHTLLHSDKPPSRAAALENKSSCNTLHAEDYPKEEVITSVHTTSDGKAYLKMVPVDLYGPKGTIRILALLDEGSTITLLDSSVAKKIGAEGQTETLTIETVGGKGIKKSNSQKVQVRIKGAHRRDKRKIEVRTIDDLKLAKQYVSKEVVRKCEHLKKMEDQLVYEREEPRLLIGQDNWGLIVTRRLKKGKASEPVASLTSLGWVLHGCDAKHSAPVNFVNYSKMVEDDTEALVRKHFEIESIGVQPRRPTNDADRRALEVLEKTTRRLPDGRFESGLLWKSDKEELQDNYSQAYRRLINIEKKLDKDEQLKEAYERQIEDLIKKGYAEKAPAVKPEKRTFYLPHFAVVHPIKKKPRIVLDAAAKFNGKSLNDALLPGPDLLQSLFGVLIRFREKPIAVVADIQEMFLRIQMREADRDSLRFLWRGDRRSGKPEEYRMASVVFGASSSPSTAIYVMQKNAEDYKQDFPAAVEAIKRNHYMDDYLQSFGSAEEARRTANEVKEIHAKAGFNLRGWSSNEPQLLLDLQGSPKEEVLVFAAEEKTLGLRWLLKEDALAFNVGLRNVAPEIINGMKTPTKREVTSAVMSTFDPMGFASPVLIQGKKLIQDIWRTKIDWDEEILEEQRKAWTNYMQEVSTLKELKIPRCLSPLREEGELHTFSDASEEAYAAAVYWRTVGLDGSVRVTLIAGKARVTPTKPVSIPRLELQAALLGSRLASTIKEELSLNITKKTFWTDSSTVLQWIKADPRKFKTFVAHRLAEIEELTRPQDWRWVPTKENPADDATRGTPAEFDHQARWFRGPAFLRHNEEEWPVKHFGVANTNTGEEKSVQTVTAVRTVEKSTPVMERFSSWTRLLRSMARVLQFIEELQRRRQEKEHTNAARRDEDWKPQKNVIKVKPCIKTAAEKEKKRTFVQLEERHLKRAEEELIKQSQRESFSKEISHLREEKPLENSSRLKRIDVFLDNRGILKLRSRTKKIRIEDRSMNPVVLDGRHQLGRLLIEHYHRRFLHGNTETVMNEIRQKYWILGLRTATKGLIHRCQWCKVRKGVPQIPPTGDLPTERLKHHQHPFTCTAVDYFGPMQVVVGRRREKRWGALFTCLTTRAVHLELANSLNTSSMIMALRRMAARRGSPKIIFSDNGTNFVGANKELEEAAMEEGIKWKFIPPGCPNMGGAWERMVRSVKTALMAVLQTKTPTEEVLHTLLTEVEHIVNSRPLTHTSADPDDEERLTPNHFLLGRSCGMASPGVFEDFDLVGKANWRTAQRLTDHFWKRWVKEYLPTLMPRTISGKDTEDPKEGDVVLIVDASLPRNTWPRGEVVKVYPGPDGRVRILDVRTPGGVLRRPTRRVVVLIPAKASPPRNGELRTAGEIVGDAPKNK